MLKISILVADNTPGGQSFDNLPPSVQYVAFPDNPGLVVPYRHAIAQAELEGFEWILTLDQDTELPLHFLSRIARYARDYSNDERVAGIVPRIFDHGRAISPFRFVGGFLPLVTGRRTGGLLEPHTSALNSASLLRISALSRVDGYDGSFPLNNSDTALFHRLDCAGYRIVLAHEVVVRHELAILSRGNRMTVERYRQLLIDERNFYDLHMSGLARCERLIRLVGRLGKSWVEKEDPAFRRVTFSEVETRLFSSRAVRIREQSQLRNERKLL